MISFIINRSFIDKKQDDGFRKCVQNEFSHCYIVDTKSDVRDNPKISGTSHNVFGIQTGVAIMFLIKKEKHEGKCIIEYMTLDDNWRKELKLDWLKNNAIENIHFETIIPDRNNRWVNQIEDNEWADLLPLSEVFSLYANGISTNRDEWVYDFSDYSLRKKIEYFISTYNQLLNEQNNKFPDLIKWSASLKSSFRGKKKLVNNSSNIVTVSYRPFVKQYYYSDVSLSDRLTENHITGFGKFLDKENLLISINGNEKGMYVLASKYCSDLHFTGDSKFIPFYKYDEDEKRTDNITDWGLKLFREHYGDEGITREYIFHYVYAVLHHPAYYKKYQLNFKDEFPRIPFYPNFGQWVAWGKALMELHIGYEAAEPYPLEVVTAETKAEAKRQKEMFAVVEEPQAMFARQPKVKAKLKAVKEAGIIELDELTLLRGIPAQAWEYKLGNRSALEWILDQYKEKKPKDSTIAEKFNTYRFADYKEQVIDLLRRVCTVSVETVRIVGEMENLPNQQ
jgi:predicted helicase